MSPIDHARLEAERHALSEAARRLLDGTPERSNGNLTATALASEAGLPRHRLYRDHADLLTDFQQHTRSGAPTPSTTALQVQLTEIRARLEEAKAENTELRAQLRTLTTALAEQSLQEAPPNVIYLPDRGTRNGRAERS